MKKIFIPFLLLILSLLFFSSSTNAAEKGTRANPFSAYDETSFTLQNYSFDTPKKIKLQLLSLKSGKSINDLMQSENMFNDIPNSKQQWSLFEFEITHISNPKDEELELADVIQYYSDDFYFDSKFKSIPFTSSATFGDIYEQEDFSTQSLYPGSKATTYTAQLFNKSTPYPYFRIQYSDDRYYWFSTDPKYKPKNTINLAKAGISTKVDGKSATYTGEALKPKITVYGKNKQKLKINTDYTIANNPPLTPLKKI